MKLAKATKLDRKSGGAKWRDLLFLSAQTNANQSTLKTLSSRRSGGICCFVHPNSQGKGRNPPSPLSSRAKPRDLQLRSTPNNTLPNHATIKDA
jgi:hypothetical protein